MVNAVGPVFAGGFETFIINDERGEDYTITFLPDRNNQELQAAGQSPVFYYLPEQVRLARKGDRGDFKFRHIHFVGIQDESSIGVDNGETQGGVLAFTTTSRFPTAVLAQAQQMVAERFRNLPDRYWGIRGNVSPTIRIAPITKNTTAVSNIVPGPEGLTPTEAAAEQLPAPPAGPADPGGPGMPGAPRMRSSIVAARGFDPMMPVPHGRGFRPAPTINPWAWRLDGQGPGSVTGGENAYAGFMGPMASEVVWAGFHGAYSVLAVSQQLIMPMWSQLMRLKIRGDWRSIFSHFSAAAGGRGLFFAADIKAEFNNMRKSGTITVEVDIDGTAPGADKMEETINKRIDTIVAEFTRIAKEVIFDPKPPQVEPAQTPKGGGIFSSIFGFGGGVALKARFDQTSLSLQYNEERYFRYNQPHTISSTLEGFYNEIKQDPAAEQKYFTRLVLGGLGRKVMRIVKPVVNWPRIDQGWRGEPVAFLSTQVGYPTEQGQVRWMPHTFQASDPQDPTWKPAFVQWRDGEVTNPPADWTSDETFVRRAVHYLEPPNESEDPFVKIIVERNVMELDPGPNGTLTNENVIEVRADQAGVLDVGPIAIDAVLESNAQVAEIEFRALGQRLDGSNRSDRVTRFRWTLADQERGRLWRVFTGDPAYAPQYEYRVSVTVKGTIFAQGQAWTGPWQTVSGNGELMARVPGPDDEGVVRRSLTPREMLSDEAVIAQPALVSEPAPSTKKKNGGVSAPGGQAQQPVSVGAGAPRPRGGAAGDDMDWSGKMPPPSSKGSSDGAPRKRSTAMRDHKGYSLAAPAGSAPRTGKSAKSRGGTADSNGAIDVSDWAEMPAGGGPNG